MTVLKPEILVAQTADSKFWWAAAVPTFGIWAASLVLSAAWAIRLPSDVATKWSADAVVEVGPLLGLVAATLGPALAMLIYLVVLQSSEKLSDWGRRSTVAILVAISLCLSGSAPLLLSPSLTVADPWLAPNPVVPGMFVLMAASVLAGVVSGYFVGRPARSGGPEEVRRVEDAPAVWTGMTTAQLFVAVAVTGVVLLGLGAFGISPWPVALLGGPMAVIGIMLSRWHVSISTQGLLIGPVYGLGFLHVPIRRGTVAVVEKSSGLLDFLGLGVRGLGTQSPRLLVRTGETLIVRGPEGESFQMSLSGASQAAAAYNEAAGRL